MPMQGTQSHGTPQNVQIIQLNLSWKREARAVLFNAYRECPLYQRLFSSEVEGFVQRLRSGIREMCSIYFDSDDLILGLLVNDRLSGVAVLCPPNRKRLADIFSWRWKMFLTAGFGCTERINEYQARVANHLHNCYQVPLIGINAEQRHLGLGKQLFDEIHRQVESDRSARGVVIDTANPYYLDYFAAQGYQVIETLSIDGLEEKILLRPNPVRLVQ
ncbi:hypothetical protein [Aestuariirhabdus litorea]|uniref:GNAT family N-acetyltransferase n=1 Tax=Aestuariirhabdus litorea TaxID=2528527 RepID=A0A3P3VQH8_9GAMM|nr:hypothetical protein [Aestuariirhabdus litorea]RRJ84714.1 hypothetical protein D0544_06320 [Aestuariirhabdus litorea]RWW97939.1 hypothetical protein DZC74_06315 [Endozoicomonadaceae bacterium GTF-13]